LSIKKYKLDLTTVLQAIDRRNLTFYSNLNEEEKKAYVPLILMRYISSVTDQNKNAAYSVLATNDLVNVGFWQLDKHKELQHMLLCLCGLGGKQYRPWIGLKNRKTKNKIIEFLYEYFPNQKIDEIEIIYDSMDYESFLDFLNTSGISSAEVKNLTAEWKKLNK
jgi:hypothetical protein